MQISFMFNLSPFHALTALQGSGRAEYSQTNLYLSKQSNFTGFVIGRDPLLEKMFIQYLRGCSFLYRVSLLAQISDFVAEIRIHHLSATISIKCTTGTANEIKEQFRGIPYSGQHLLKFIYDLHFNTGGTIFFVVNNTGHEISLTSRTGFDTGCIWKWRKMIFSNLCGIICHILC